MDQEPSPADHLPTRNHNAAHVILTDFDKTFNDSNPQLLDHHERVQDNATAIEQKRLCYEVSHDNMPDVYHARRTHEDENHVAAFSSDVEHARNVEAPRNNFHGDGHVLQQTKTHTGSRYEHLRNQHFLSPLQRNK